MPGFSERVADPGISQALMKPPERWLDLGHARLPYWVIGTGPALVLVHGWPADGRTWRRIVPLLAEHFTCHVLDRPGESRSTWTATPQHVWDGWDVCAEPSRYDADASGTLRRLTFEACSCFTEIIILLFFAAAQLPAGSCRYWWAAARSSTRPTTTAMAAAVTRAGAMAR